MMHKRFHQWHDKDIHKLVTAPAGETNGGQEVTFQHRLIR